MKDSDLVLSDFRAPGEIPPRLVWRMLVRRNIHHAYLPLGRRSLCGKVSARYIDGRLRPGVIHPAPADWKCRTCVQVARARYGYVFREQL